MPKAARNSGSDAIYYQDGSARRRTTYTFYRGENANFYPSDDTLERDDAVAEYIVKGMVPAAPMIDRSSRIIAFGSCFASNVSSYLYSRGYSVLNKTDDLSYVARMGDGIVNTYAIRQQFDWAWGGNAPEVELWHDYDATSFGYDENVRRRTKALFDEADVFIITLGLSEVWFDEPTGEVFWRAVPADRFDPTRHKFRLATFEENLANIRSIYARIRENRPDAVIIFTLSPVPLTATFRHLSCVAANTVSKAVLRSALDAFMSKVVDQGLFYFPSFEIVLACFRNQFMEDKKHIHEHILHFNMKVFERYFCLESLSDSDLRVAFDEAQKLDRQVGRYGHWSVPRTLRDREGVRRGRPPLRISIANLLTRALGRLLRRRNSRNTAPGKLKSLWTRLGRASSKTLRHVTTVT